MEKLLINGNKDLNGEISISGSKNAALPIIFATLLSHKPILINNIPKLQDVNISLKLLKHFGSKIQYYDQHSVCLESNSLISLDAPYELVKKMRASILSLGPLLTRFGEVKVSLPGGCAIGQRPVDQHISALKKMGAKICIDHGFIIAKCNKLKGCTIKNNIVSVTGTENIMMAAVLAEGTTIIENAACEPEIVDLANFLIQIGAKIYGHGTPKIIIDGVHSLHGVSYKISSDRIEAGTFMCAVGATKGDILLKNVNPLEMKATISILRSAGLNISTGDNWIRCQMFDKPLPINFETDIYPGIPTDMQAQLMALSTVAKGKSLIIENIFENRFMHAQELCRLGANIDINGNKATIYGVNYLSGTNVLATDLRASASLIIAGLSAKGETLIEDIYHLDRGYENMEFKLNSIGADIKRIIYDED
ncbi:UDP-N-acetylglucosamine 1-carboxyvinyltransferase [Candidatus Kinetoplastibacterium sorsogonicusi]|uniref:UDP-N-acetylglucosamine 1-carboxyvinyltransferase n=1 Tax=Candidatus Kinetoplastidibacterium kentomonadis TaxID=1576550 RepID=A0A3Q8ETU3_9PROT|nr:UDP-N-acetylglucosamine 1-carboxyvinyltransferase [Candidatus Kinetoplastibacterium sorsogonicusi]AWD32171.1 UDP-N-acetylglucosamine 1-carboxyvinyltransferase [Candidatus Kinetoplastibacterium sorsogonicusi]